MSTDRLELLLQSGEAVHGDKDRAESAPKGALVISVTESIEAAELSDVSFEKQGPKAMVSSDGRWPRGEGRLLETPPRSRKR